MSRTVLFVHHCDRCGVEFDPNPHWNTPMIASLSYMVKRNGSGTKIHGEEKEFCQDCSGKFLKFMKSKLEV